MLVNYDKVTGARNIALGANDKPKSTGTCKHPSLSFTLDLPKELLHLKHCIFCKETDKCFFAGDCEYRKDD